MSIIGEMYEEQIWGNTKELQEKCQAFLIYLNSTATTDYVALNWIREEFKEKFAKELKGNDR